MAPVPSVWLSSSDAQNLAMEAGKAGGWVDLRPRIAGKWWQKDKEARVLRGWPGNSWSGELWAAASRLLRGGETLTDDGRRGKGRFGDLPVLRLLQMATLSLLCGILLEKFEK